VRTPSATLTSKSENVPVKVPDMYSTEKPTVEWTRSTDQVPAGTVCILLAVIGIARLLRTVAALTTTR
jgi:hypothetical protein